MSTKIDFESPPYLDNQEYCGKEAIDKIEDSENGITFTITQGKMSVIDGGKASGHYLFFSNVDCEKKLTPDKKARLEIKFDQPQTHVGFNATAQGVPFKDEPYEMIVRFFVPGTKVTPIKTEKLFADNDQSHSVHYSSYVSPINLIRIETEHSECCLYWIAFKRVKLLGNILAYIFKIFKLIFATRWWKHV